MVNRNKSVSNKNSKNALNYLVKGEEIVIFATTIFIALAMFIQVILRYIFNAPLFGLEEISVFVLAWFTFIGAAYSVQTESYIKADLISLVIKNPKIKKPFDIIAFILCICSTAILSYYGYKYAVWSYNNHVISPTFLISSNFGFAALVVGGVLMSLHFFYLLIRELKKK